MALEEKYRGFMSDMLRVQAEKLAQKPLKLELKTAEALSMLALLEEHFAAPENKNSTDEFNDLLRNAHMRISAALNVQQ